MDQMRYFVVLLLLTSGFFASAQKMDVPKYREVIVITPEGTIKCQVKLKKQKTRTNEKYSYVWYSNNKIQSTQGGYDGTLLDGFYKEYDNADRLLVQGEYKKGLKSGEWKSWYANGKLKEISHWCKGKQYGEHKTFDEEGNISTHFNYTCKGKKDVIAANLEKQKKKEACIAKCKQKSEDRKKAKEEKAKLKEEKAKQEEKEKSVQPNTDSKPVK